MEYVAEAPHSPLSHAAWPRCNASAVIDFLVITAISVPLLAPTLTRLLNESTETNPASFTAGEIRTRTIISIAVPVGYFTGLHAWRGSTVGKMATRTMLVRDEGQPVTVGVAFSRAVSLIGINFVSGFLLL